MAIIDFMTGEQMVEAIEHVNQAVSGMTAQEAAAALGATVAGAGSGAKIIQFPMQAASQSGAITLGDVLANQAWEDYTSQAETAGRIVTAFGSAAAAAKATASGVLFGTGEGLAAGGLLTLSVPTAIAMATPLLGVACGEALYNAQPELFNKIAEKITPYVYEGTQVVAAAVDKLGQVLIPKGLVDAIKELFDEEGINPDSPPTGEGTYESKYPGIVLNFGTLKTSLGTVTTDAEYTLCTSDGVIHGFKRGSRPVGTYPNGDSAFSSNVTTTVDGTVWYIGNGSLQYRGTSPARSNVSSNANGLRTIADIIMNGTVPHPGTLPEGMTQWEGTRPATLPEVPVIIVIPEDPGQSIVEVPYTPIQIPEPGAPPYISPDPEKQPNPQAPVPLPYIDPFINPYVPWQWPEELPKPTPDPEQDPDSQKDPLKAPIPDPVSRPTPYVDPYIDPSKQPDPIKTPDPAPVPDPRIWPDSPTTPQPPESTGDSPPILPDFYDFPSIAPDSDVGGLIHIYNPTSGEMQAFGRWLWVTWQDATIEKIWNNPFDGVIGAMELYVTPNTGGSEGIRSGFLQSSVSAKTVPVRYKTINCGSIVIPEYWKNYLDYAPYTKAYIYLPFIGIVEVESDDIVGHAVNIVYHVDCYNGSCIAQITVARDNYTNTVYQYSGNCAVDVPMAGGTQAAIRAGMMQAAAYGISSVISGILGGNASSTPAGSLSSIGSGIAYGAANAISSVVSAKSSVQHSGTFGASYGAMGIKRPYIIIRRPIQKVVDNYNKDYGFPAHKMVQIGTCTGFLRVREVNVISPTASNEEKAMIEQLLKTGVYVTS